MAKKVKPSANKRTKKTPSGTKPKQLKVNTPASQQDATKKVVTATPASTAPKKQKGDPVNAPSFGQELPFDRMNYILMAIGVAILAIGFILMGQDEFVDANEFSVSLYVAPLIVMAGFIEIIYAIMYRSKKDKTPVTPEMEG